MFNSYLVKNDNESILIDTGLKIQEKRFMIKLNVNLCNQRYDVYVSNVAYLADKL